jgi:hypothetical protein
VIIAELIDADSKASRGRAYLAETPFPGDTVATAQAVYTVIRRRFLDLGPGEHTDRLSAELIVRVLS